MSIAHFTSHVSTELKVSTVFSITREKNDVQGTSGKNTAVDHTRNLGMIIISEF